MPITTLNSTMLSLRLQLDSNTQTLSTSLKRMSSGLKINSATDGAADVVISSKLNTKISGMNIAQNNVQQAISMLNCADSSLSGLLEITNRIRDLSLQALNGTYSDVERKVMQDEAKALEEEFYRLKNSANYNKISLFGDNKETIESAGVIDSINTKTRSISNSKTSKSAEELNDIYGEGNWVAITSRAELEAIPAGNESSGKIYVLMGDIDLSGKDWQPIGYGTSWGNFTNPFRGTLDGNGYTISNLTINQPSESAKGLFGSIQNATIKNLELRDVNIKGYENVGAISGQAGGSTVENCIVSGKVEGTYSGDGRNNGFIGGLIGVATDNTKINNCASDVDVIGAGRNTGGLVGHGYTNTKISNSYTTGDVTGKNSTGGIIGFPQGVTVENCYSTGNITGENNVGGIAGSNEGVTINNSYSTGTITGSGTNVGGLSGGGGTISNSFATGYPTLAPSGSITNSYGLTAQDGVEAKDPDWFKEGSNLTFLGGEYDFSHSPPQVSSNPEALLFPPAKPPDTGPPDKESLRVQVGSKAGVDNTIYMKFKFSIDDFTTNVSTEGGAAETLRAVEKLQKTLLEKQSEIGAVLNRLDGVIELQNNEIINLNSTKSLITDTDYALESCNLAKNQILQQVSTSLMSQCAQQSSNLALRLLSFR